MNERNLYEINKIRNERNKKLDIAAERLSHCVVNSEQGAYSPIYLIQDAEAQELLDKVLSDSLMQKEQTRLLNIFDKDVLKKSIADSVYQAPEYPLGDEEVAFLSFNRDNETAKSVKLKNLFKKSQFSIVNFLKRISHTIFDAVSSLPSVGEDKDNVISSVFRLICCIIFTMSTLIQEMTIDFDEKYCKILFELLNDENGLLGINKDNFVNNLFTNNSVLFKDKEDIEKHIDKLISLGCVDIRQCENNEALIFIKEKIIRVK